MTLRKKLVRLAYHNSKLRPHILPLLKEGAASALGDEFKEAPQGMQKLSITIKEFQKKLADIQATHEMPQKSQKLVKQMHRSLENAKFFAEAAADLMVDLIKLTSDPDEFAFKQGGRWLDTYLRSFHPIVSRIYRKIKGPVNPDGYAAVSEMAEQLSALHEVIVPYYELIKDVKARLYQHAGTRNRDQAVKSLPTISAKLYAAGEALSDAYLQASDLAKDMKLGGSLWTNYN